MSGKDQKDKKENEKKKEEKKSDLGSLEEDDDFEEFPMEGMQLTISVYFPRSTRFIFLFYFFRVFCYKE